MWRACGSLQSTQLRRCLAGRSSTGEMRSSRRLRSLEPQLASLQTCRFFSGLSSRARLGARGASPSLRELWHRPRAEMVTSGGAAVSPQEPVASATVHKHLESAHHWEMQHIFGDPMSSTPPSAKHLFISCGLIEGIFLCINIATMSPMSFEMLMPYHLKYTGLIIGWWGGTYMGLNIARYGPLKHGPWFAARTAALPIFVLLGFVGLALADGVPGAPKMGPWPSYWILIGSFTGMGAFDLALHQRQMIPPWLLKWKLGISFLIISSLLLGVLKGQYLERNATSIIMAQTWSGNDD